MISSFKKSNEYKKSDGNGQMSDREEDKVDKVHESVCDESNKRIKALEEWNEQHIVNIYDLQQRLREMEEKFEELRNKIDLP